jgi:hypothetical protein
MASDAVICRLGAGERAHEHTVSVREIDDVLRRRAERVDEQLRRVVQRDLDVRGAVGVHTEPGRDEVAAREVLRQRRHAVFGEQRLDQVEVALRDERQHVRGAGVPSRSQIGVRTKASSAGRCDYRTPCT